MSIGLLPELRRGVGANPENGDGACLVQVAAYLSDGQSWTDAPDCVHVLLADAAIAINDTIGDDARPGLARLAPRLINTADTAPEVSLHLLLWTLDHLLTATPDHEYAPLARHVLDDLRNPAGTTEEALESLRDHVFNTIVGAHTDTTEVRFEERDGEIAIIPILPDVLEVAVSAIGVALDVAAVELVSMHDAVRHLRDNGTDDTGLEAFLTAMLDEFERLTDRAPLPLDTARWAEVCRLLGTVQA